MNLSLHGLSVLQTSEKFVDEPTCLGTCRPQSPCPSNTLVQPQLLSVQQSGSGCGLPDPRTQLVLCPRVPPGGCGVLFYECTSISGQSGTDLSCITFGQTGKSHQSHQILKTKPNRTSSSKLILVRRFQLRLLLY